ncbi:hypothetical protein EXIGLDRAFT_735558 [Exidia glandulosa HHB12029]|uniref:Transmembrane protein n=1 Tax=Exidia glandulosa HHB12029 TaxID=1314781 RepID=A0A165JS53_EXIGL|nr:hypothetical protein EXIGLDRAFT_735558 [Exidia glandulosa HHB12029]
MFLAERLLLLWIFLWSWSGARAACTSSSPYECCAPDASDWMLNQSGKSPCQLLEQLMQFCQPSFSVPFLGSDMNCPTVEDPPNMSPSPCCCSTVSYTLFAACRLCQSESSSQTSYQAFLDSCGAETRLGDLPSTLNATESSALSLPPWVAIVPLYYDRPWDWQTAFLNESQTRHSSSTASHTPTASPAPTRPVNIAALVASISAIISIGLILGVVYYLRIRRRRVDPHASQKHKRLVDLSEQLDAPTMEDPGAPVVLWGNAHRLPQRPPRVVAYHDPPARAPQRVSVTSSDPSPLYGPGHRRPLPPSAQYLLSIGQRPPQVPPLFSDRTFGRVV